jgi:hypothetical protein
MTLRHASTSEKWCCYDHRHAPGERWSSVETRSRVSATGIGSSQVVQLAALCQRWEQPSRPQGPHHALQAIAHYCGQPGAAELSRDIRAHRARTCDGCISRAMENSDALSDTRLTECTGWRQRSAPLPKSEPSRTETSPQARRSYRQAATTGSVQRLVREKRYATTSSADLAKPERDKFIERRRACSGRSHARHAGEPMDDARP